LTIRGIIFDLDGTLADTLPVCVQSFQYTIEHFRGWRPLPEEIYALFGTNEEGILDRLAPGCLQEMLPYFLNTYEELHSLCPKPFPGIERVFETIQRKKKTAAIVTGKGKLTTAISMRLLGLDRFVQQVETGFQDRSDKPFGIRSVLSQWNCAPEEAAYIGDALSDMGSAQAAGVHPLGAAWAGTSEMLHLDALPAYPVFYEIPSFIDWIERI
jgi:pyrophosphatase PpaX